MKSIWYRYFIYSQEEEELKKKIDGENASFGSVIVRGIPKRYTSIVIDKNKTKADSIIVTEGDIRKIKYTQPKRNV